MSTTDKNPLSGPQDDTVGGHNLNPGDAHSFNPQPDIPGNQATPGGDLNPGDIYEFNPQPDIPGNQAMPGIGGGDPAGDAALKPGGGDPADQAMLKPPGGGDPAGRLGGVGVIGVGLFIGLLVGFGFLLFGPPQTVMGFFNMLGSGQLCTDIGDGLLAGNRNLAPVVLVESVPGPPDHAQVELAPGLPDEPAGNNSNGNQDWMPVAALVNWDNGLRLAFGQGMLFPDAYCGHGPQQMSAPFGGNQLNCYCNNLDYICSDGSVEKNSPSCYGVPSTPPVDDGSIDGSFNVTLIPTYSGGKPAVSNADPTVGACVPIPDDGLCSACENTDLDSQACVCNMNGRCDPQEGSNCGDCQPTSQPGGGGSNGRCGDGRCNGGEDATTCSADCHR